MSRPMHPHYQDPLTAACAVGGAGWQLGQAALGLVGAVEGDGPVWPAIGNALIGALILIGVPVARDALQAALKSWRERRDAGSAREAALARGGETALERLVALLDRLEAAHAAAGPPEPPETQAR